jgi:lytic murein transglycosylase B
MWIVLAALLSPMPAAAAVIAPQATKEALARQLESEFKLPAPLVRSTLASARFSPSVIARMQRPYEARPYAEYRPLFVNPRLARQGKAYLTAHKEAFARAEHIYGVQPEIIAAILGMETRFGRSQGRDRVLDALYTLAVGYPRRADFFRRELGHFILLCREEHLQPDRLLGSYAGAFGTTQFIPSSYRLYAVDADGDGRRDVWSSSADIIESVANYFHAHGWETGRPMAHWLPQTEGATRRRELLVQNGRLRWHRLGAIRNMLPQLPSFWHDEDRVAVIRLDTARGPRNVLIHHNFYVITRWNHSYNYAMAATELAAMMGCDRCRTGR